MNMVWSMVFASGLPLKFLDEVAEHAAYILNRSPTESKWRWHLAYWDADQETTILRYIVVVGSPFTVHLKIKNKSLGVRGKAAIIIGMDDEMNAYRSYIPKERVVV